MAPDHGKDSETSRWNLSARRNDVDPKPHVVGVSTYLPKEQLMNDTRTSSGFNAVYVQTNSSPNEVIAFRRSDDGSLDRIGSVATTSSATSTTRSTA